MAYMFGLEILFAMPFPFVLQWNYSINGKRGGDQGLLDNACLKRHGDLIPFYLEFSLSVLSPFLFPILLLHVLRVRLGFVFYT